MDSRIDKLKSNLSDQLEIPKDIVMDLPKITCIGNAHMNIENYKNVVEYSTELIRLKTKDGMLKIEGMDIKIEFITTDEILITGKISSVDFFK